MPTSNENIRNALIRHQIFAIRASGTLSKRIIETLNEAEDDLRAKIEARLARVRERGFDLGPATTRRLIELERDIQDLLEKPHRTAAKDVEEFLTDASVREPIFVKELIEDALPVTVNFRTPNARVLRSMVKSRPFHGRVLRDWMKGFETNDRTRMMQEIRIGLVQGKSVQQISRRIFGTRALRGRDGARQITRNGADIIARTSTNAILNNARQEFFKENKGLIKFEVYTATLDSRTTLICSSLDGTRFEVGKGRFPPLHIRCRSTRIPTIDGSLVGVRPKNEAVQSELKGLSQREKRRLIRGKVGQVPASQSFQTFLKGQTRAFQHEILGSQKKVDLFRSGKLPLKKFVDQKTGRPFSLDDLMRREPQAFRDAA